MTTAPPQLDYAPGAPIRRRRRRWRRVMGLLLLAGLVFAAWWFHKPVWEQAKLLYYQRQCLNYTAPPEQVVYDENYGTVSPLIGTAGYQALPRWQNYNMRSRKLLGTVAVRAAPELENYSVAMGWPRPLSGLKFFCMSGAPNRASCGWWRLGAGRLIQEQDGFFTNLD